MEVDELLGPKGRWNPDRTAVRHGREDGEVTLGGRRVAVRRARVRTADGESKLSLLTYEHFADRNQLGQGVLERTLAGVATRKYRRAPRTRRPLSFARRRAPRGEQSGISMVRCSSLLEHHSTDAAHRGSAHASRRSKASEMSCRECMVGVRGMRALLADSRRLEATDDLVAVPRTGRSAPRAARPVRSHLELTMGSRPCPF